MLETEMIVLNLLFGHMQVRFNGDEDRWEHDQPELPGCTSDNVLIAQEKGGNKGIVIPPGKLPSLAESCLNCELFCSQRKQVALSSSPPLNPSNPTRARAPSSSPPHRPSLL